MMTALLIILIVVCVVLLVVVATYGSDLPVVLWILLIALAMALIAGAATILLRS